MSPSTMHLLAVSSVLALASAFTQVNIRVPFMNKNIDPIKFPGSYDKSHLHAFYGSDAVTANTKTSAELQGGCTNADNPNDLSTYWTPTLLYTADGGATYKPMPLSRFSAYYNLGETPAEIAMPQNLKMVAGNAGATTKDAMVASAQTTWFCEGGSSDDIDANGFPTSTCATHVQQLIYFPQCVNPSTLATAYKNRRGGSCPAGMKSMPQLRYSIRYDARKVLPRGWSGTAPFKLACGPAWCSHGDFFNGWTADAATNMLAATSDKQKFSTVDGKLGKHGVIPSCKAADAEPDKGTADYAKSVAVMAKRAVAAWGWVSHSRLARFVTHA